MVPILLLTACLERTTGEFVPLDPRYTRGHEQEAGVDGAPADPNAGGTGDGAYVGYKGATVKVTGVVQSLELLPVQIDVNEPDAGAPGGQKRVGAIHLPEPGLFELDVPADRREVRFQAFQDPQVDGPSEDDPFAQVTVPLHGEPPAPLTIVLVKGARGRPEGPAPTEGAPPAEVFPPGPRVSLSGTVDARLPGRVSVDFFRHAPEAPGGRTYLFKIQSEPNVPWTQAFPVDFGLIAIEAYQDAAADGPTPGDPRANYEPSPVTVAGSDISGLDIRLP